MAAKKTEAAKAVEEVKVVAPAKEEAKKAPAKKVAAPKKAAAPKATEKKVEAPKAEEKKVEAPKAAAKKAPAKKAAPAKKVETAIDVMVQYDEKTINTKDIVKAVEADYKKSNKAEIKSLNIYVKPADNKAYYVVNDGIAGSVEL